MKGVNKSNINNYINKSIMMNESDIEKLISENKRLKDEILQEKNNYRQVSMELGQAIYKEEELKEKIKKYEEKIQELEEEVEELRLYKEEKEASAASKIKSIFK